MYFKKTDSRLFPLYNKNISIYAKYKKKQVLKKEHFKQSVKQMIIMFLNTRHDVSQ